MAQNFQTHKEKMYNQIQEQYGKLLYTYTCNLKQAALLEKESKKFKWVQIILSAISAGGFFATAITDQTQLAWIGGILSTALLAVNAYLKNKDYAAEEKSHIDAALKLWPLREEYIYLF